jgi:hypothetical protein
MKFQLFRPRFMQVLCFYKPHIHSTVDASTVPTICLCGFLLSNHVSGAFGVFFQTMKNLAIALKISVWLPCLAWLDFPSPALSSRARHEVSCWPRKTFPLGLYPCYTSYQLPPDRLFHWVAYPTPHLLFIFTVLLVLSILRNNLELRRVLNH